MSNHDNKNNRKINPGEIVIIDIGAEYNMYSADITRTIPISGIFSDRQKEIYNIVLKAHDEAISLVHPGIEKSKIHIKAASMRGIVEEAPGAYKDVFEVIEITTKAGIGKAVVKVRPLGVLKG